MYLPSFKLPLVIHTSILWLDKSIYSVLSLYPFNACDKNTNTLCTELSIRTVRPFSTKLCNQVPSLSLSRWRTLTLEKIKISWVLWCIKIQTKSQLLRRVLWMNAQLTIVSSLKHHSTQTIYIFNKENPQNSESPNGSIHSFVLVWPHF